MNKNLENMIKQRFEYDPARGLIEKATGKLCEVKHLRADDVRVRVKNAAWWLHTGEWPANVRALDGDYLNLKIENLTPSLRGEKAQKRAERLKVEAKEAKTAEKAAKLAALPPPVVTMYFQNDEWHIRARGYIRTYKKYKAARAAMDEFYYTSPELENK